MLLAKLALGFCGTIFVAGAYTFHEGVMRVDADNPGGPHIHVWVPAAIVPRAGIEASIFQPRRKRLRRRRIAQ